MNKGIGALIFPVFVAGIVALSIWGPESLSQYQDKQIFGAVHQQEAGLTGEGYRYTLSANEKLLLLARALDSQKRWESGQNGANFVLIVNHRGPSEGEISQQEIYEVCNEQLEALKELEVLPEEVREVDPELYDAVLYSAIDAREPRNHLAVWRVSLSSSLRNVNKENRLIDAYIDAENGKIYEFYTRINHDWEDMDPDPMMKAWSGYIGLAGMEPCENGNPLTEATPNVKKYVFSGAEGETETITLGFYDGIRELFISVSSGR